MYISSDTASLNSAAHRLARLLLGGLASVLLGCILAAPAEATIYTYDNTTSGATAFVTSNGNCDSGTGALNRTFVVSDSFTVASIALGLNVSHVERGDYRIRLEAPGGTAFDFIIQGGDADDNYDIQMSTNSDGAGVPALDDNTTDPVGEPYFARLVNIAGANFYTGNANGTWTLRVCDRDNNGVNGTFNRARLILTSTEVVPTVCTSTVVYEWELNGNNNAFTNVTVGGVTLTLTSTRDLTADGANTAGRNNFTTQTGTFGNQVGYYIMQFDDGASGAPQSPEAVLLESTWTFSPSVRYQTWRHLDIDNGSWEDYIRVRGLDAASATVPYSLTLGPVHQLAGDIIETDGANVVDTSTDGNVDYSFATPIGSVVVEYMRGDDDADPASQRIGIGTPSFCAFDYGDAPDTYGTLLAGGARHILGNRDLWLGANQPDGESDGQVAGGVATADDLAAVGGIDDEDGVASFTACPNNGTYSVTVSASDVRTSGANGAIRGYMDWNRDGDFADANEISAATSVPRTDADPTSYSVTWGSVPANCGGTASTFARFRFSTDTAAVASPTGLAPDGEVEDYEISSATLPVTIAHVETVANDNSTSLSFTTATESGNAGFRVWGTNAKGTQMLLATMKSQGSDSFVPQSYATTLRGAGFTSIEIEDISVFGKNRMHGPYAVGSSFGEEPEAKAIDWAALKNESGLVSDLERVVAAEGGDGAERAAGLAALAAPTTSAAGGLLLVRNEGIHRVTYEELRAAGIELVGVDPNKIAVVDNGTGIPRSVSTVGATFGPGGSIEFVARPQLTLASPVDAYVLMVNARKAVAAGSLLSGAGALGVTVATDLYRPDNIYSFSSPNGDPWMDAQVLAWGGPGVASRTFDLPNLAAGAVSVKVRVWGWGDFDGAAPDHHVVVKVNGTEVGQQRFDGLTTWEAELDVTGLVNESGNSLEIYVPGDTGYAFDNIAFEGFDASYSRATVARGGRFQGTVARRAFAIGGFGASEPVSVWKLSGATATRNLQSPVGDAVSAAGGLGDVYAASQSALFRPGISAGVPAAKLSSSAEYVIVTHPAFASSVGDLVALEESRGFTTEVVTVDRIFAAYSDHASSAAALKSFLSASLARGNLRNVLLVGADTSDPYNHLGTGSVSYVPTDYRNFVAVVTFSPTDESLVDRGNDGLGDVPIGRLPVRTPAELEAVVTKLYAWEQAIGSGQPSALLAAGLSDGARAIATVNESYGASLSGWNTVLAQVDDSNTATVRQQALDAISAGAHLVSYVGHSSMGQWDFTPILKWQDVETLINSGLPNLFTAWGCWNSYYVDPTIESLSARLLRQSDAGAAGAIGATTLTSESSHRLLGNLFFARVNAGARTVGQAFHGAKQDLQQQGGAADAILGMTLLGDPAMSLPQL